MNQAGREQVVRNDHRYLEPADMSEETMASMDVIDHPLDRNDG